MNYQDADFIHTFIGEAKDFLEEWERHCLALETKLTQAGIDALFRSAHNLKGAARSVGLDAFAQQVHHAEDLISSLRSQKIKLQPVHVSILLRMQSFLLDWIKKIGAAPIEQAASADYSNDAVELIASIKIAANGEVSVEKSEAPPNETGTALSAADFFREENVASLEHSNSKMKEKLVDSPDGKDLISDSGSAGNVAVETLRIPSTKIDSLMSIVGEISTQQAIIEHHHHAKTQDSSSFGNAIQITSKLVKELQTEALALRMQPVAPLFQRLERAAKDLARNLDKKINIAIDGEQVELDKSVIERITDSFVHIIRNAVDHGVESPDDREKSGKKPTATIVLEASVDASGAVLKLRDDGRGIDTDKILTKARKLGLVGDDTSSLTKSQIYDLLFLPGFSTAEKVTDISGRGVGLDVVKKAIHGLGGSLSIQSEMGQGSQFTISLPTNVSIVDSIVVAVDGESYVVPIHEIDEVIDIKTFKVETVTNQSPVISLRERTVPVKDLRDYLTIAQKINEKNSEKIGTRSFGEPALVVAFEDHTLAFKVDQIMSQQAIVVRKLSGKVGDLPGFSGSTILASGEPAVILSLKVFVRNYFNRIAA